MKVEVSYLVRKEVEVELTEKLFRELYNKFHESLFARSLIEDEIYEYLEQESGYIAADGEDIDYDVSIEDWVWDMFEKISQEE
jgi:hypothetical protein